MKNVLKLVSALALTAVAFNASAEQFAYPAMSEVSYSLPSHVGGGDQIYYNCDSVESTVKSMLKKLGAEDIRVRCTGGIDEWSTPTSAFVTAKFVAASMVKNNQAPRVASIKSVTLRDDGNCHLYNETLMALSEGMELDVVDGPSYCSSGSRIRNKFEVSVLAFE